MGIESNYDEKRKKEESLTYPQVCKKIKSGNGINAEELAVYIKGKQKRKSCTRRTIDNYIKNLCNMSNGLLKIEDFKKNEDYFFEGKSLKFLLTIINTGYFGNRKKNPTLKDREKIYNQLLKNVKEYLDEEDEKLLKSYPEYLNAQLEAAFTKHLNRELYAMNNIMYHAEPTIRYQLMVEALDMIVKLRRWMQEWDITISENRLLFADDIESYKRALKEEGEFSKASFEMRIIELLADKIHNHKSKFISDSEELSRAATYIASKDYHMYGKSDNEIQQYLEQVDQAIENDEKYQKLKEKAVNILDITDPIEEKMYYQLLRISRTFYAAPFVHPDDYAKMVRFTESCIVNDKRKIFELLNFDWIGLLTKERIEQIMNIKDRIDLKNEMIKGEK